MYHQLLGAEGAHLRRRSGTPLLVHNPDMASPESCNGTGDCLTELDSFLKILPDELHSVYQTWKTAGLDKPVLCHEDSGESG